MVPRSHTLPSPKGKYQLAHLNALLVFLHFPSAALHLPHPSGVPGRQGSAKVPGLISGSSSRLPSASARRGLLSASELWLCSPALHTQWGRQGAPGVGGFSSFSLVGGHSEAVREPWRERAEKIRGRESVVKGVHEDNAVSAQRGLNAGLRAQSPPEACVCLSTDCS